MSKTETKLQIYMPAGMRERVHQAAERLRVSESEWIRRAIQMYLNGTVPARERREGK